MKVSHVKPAVPKTSPKFRNPLPKAIGTLVIATLIVATAGIYIGNSPPPPPPPATTPRRLPRDIRIVLDTSASMNGYFSGKTEFKDFLSKIIASIRGLVPNDRATNISYYFTRNAGEDLETYDRTAEELIEDVLNSRVSTGGSSMLGDVIAELTQDPRADRTDVFITDGIPSYPNSQVKQSPEINRDNLEGLASQLQTILQNAKWTERKIQPSLAVLQYLSTFHGTYYTYRNERVPCCEFKRPFYVWVLGPSEIVKGLTAAFTDRSDLAPIRSALVGAPVVKAAPRVLQYSMRTGTWARSRVDLLRVQGVAAESEKITVALNIPDMPRDTLESAHVLKHLTAKSDFARITPVNFVARDRATLDAHDEDVLQGATHFLTLSVSGLEVDVAAVRVSLPNIPPVWTQAVSTDDDRAIGTLNPSPTFGLLPLISGMSRALQHGESVFDFELALER